VAIEIRGLNLARVWRAPFHLFPQVVGRLDLLIQGADHTASGNYEREKPDGRVERIGQSRNNKNKYDQPDDAGSLHDLHSSNERGSAGYSNAAGVNRKE
jgi:hypothetical protein